MGDKTLEREFIVSDKQKDRTTKALQKSRALHGEPLERMDAAKALQARIRSMLLRPMYPWLYVARLAQYREPTMNSKKASRNTNSSLGMAVTGLPLLS